MTKRQIIVSRDPHLITVYAFLTAVALIFSIIYQPIIIFQKKILKYLKFWPHEYLTILEEIS